MHTHPLSRTSRFDIPGQEHLSSLISDTAPIVLAARYSAPSGTKARQSAINDLMTALGRLDSWWGSNTRLTDLVPEEAELHERLRNANPERSETMEGAKFSNRYVVLDLRPSAPVVILLSTGSAKKLDEAAQQPFVRFLLKVLKEKNSPFLFARRLDRAIRRGSQAGAITDALTGRYLGDMRRPPRRIDSIESLLVVIEAYMSEHETDTLEAKSLQGMRTNTAKRMERGRASYGIGIAVPPGFGKARLKSDTSAGRSIVYLDDPRWRPTDAECSYGNSAVEASQVDNVRFVLSHLGRSDWPASRVATELANRSYSTDGLRTHEGNPAAVYTHAHLTEVTLRSLLKNLDVYETGVLRRSLADGGAIEIQNCIPPDGPWAGPDDFDRIRDYRNRGGVRGESSLRLVLAGITVEYEGKTLRLRTQDTRAGGGPFAYRLRRSGGEALPGTPLVDAMQLNNALRDSIAAAGDRALDVVPVRAPVTSDVLAARDRCDDATAAVDDLSSELDQLYAQVKAAGTAHGALWERMNREYEEIEKAKLPAAQEELRRAKDELERAEGRARGTRRDVQAAELLQLLSALADPQRLTYASLLRQAVRNARIVVVQSPEGPMLEFSAGLAVGNGSVAADIPIRGTWPLMAQMPDEDIARIVIERLGEGVTLWEQRPPRARLLGPAIRTVLGRKEIGFVGCSDSRLLRIGMQAAILQPERHATELAADLGEPVELIERIRAVWATLGRNWMKTAASKNQAALLLLASTSSDGSVSLAEALRAGISESSVDQLGRNGWWRRNGTGLTVVPCAHCGSRSLAAPRIYEIDGLLCLDCRRDSSGIYWPAEYDRFIERVDLYVAAGVIAPCEPAVTQPLAQAPRQPMSRWLAARYESI